MDLSTGSAAGRAQVVSIFEDAEVLALAEKIRSQEAAAVYRPKLLTASELAQTLRSPYDVDLSATLQLLLDDLGFTTEVEAAPPQPSAQVQSDATILSYEQYRLLASFLPTSDTRHVKFASTSQPTSILLETLSRLALRPALTTIIMARFAPIWADLVARWLDYAAAAASFDEGSREGVSNRVLEVLRAFSVSLEFSDAVYP